MSKYTVLNSWMNHGRKVISFWRERGLKEGLKTLHQVHEVQVGTLKGVDKWGNQYWEDLAAVTGRNRYVVYPSRKQVNASAVPPEWHAWLHYMNDENPVDHPPAPLQFKLQHEMTCLSKQGVQANYLPPGHFLSERRTHYGSTSAGSSEKLEGAYDAWQSSKQEQPENSTKWATKIERR